MAVSYEYVFVVLHVFCGRSGSTYALRFLADILGKYVGTIHFIIFFADWYSAFTALAASSVKASLEAGRGGVKVSPYVVREMAYSSNRKSELCTSWFTKSVYGRYAAIRVSAMRKTSRQFYCMSNQCLKQTLEW